MTDQVEEVPQEEMEQEVANAPKSLLDESAGFQLLSMSGGFNKDRVKMMIYGDSGSGKTVLASTFPSPIFLNLDMGLGSVTRKVYAVPLDPSDPIPSWAALENALAWLETRPKKIKTVVLDSINELQTLSRNYIVARFPSIRRAYDNLASQSDYGKLVDDVEKVLRRLKALPYNVVYTCNATPRQYEGDPVSPLMIGKHLPKIVVGMMDIIGYIYKVESGDSQRQEDGGDSKPRVMVVDAVGYVTKDRSRVLPSMIHNPTYQVLYDHWKRR